MTRLLSALMVLCALSMSACSIADREQGGVYQLPDNYNGCMEEIAQRFEVVETLIGAGSWDKARQEVRVMLNISAALISMRPDSANTSRLYRDYKNKATSLRNSNDLLLHETTLTHRWDCGEEMHKFASRFNDLSENFGSGLRVKATLKTDPLS